MPVFACRQAGKKNRGRTLALGGLASSLARMVGPLVLTPVYVFAVSPRIFSCLVALTLMAHGLLPCPALPQLLYGCYRRVCGRGKLRRVPSARSRGHALVLPRHEVQDGAKQPHARAGETLRRRVAQSPSRQDCGHAEGACKACCGDTRCSLTCCDARNATTTCGSAGLDRQWKT